MSAMPLRAPTHPGAVESAPSEDLRSRREAAIGRLRVVRAPLRPRTRVPFVLTCVGLLLSALLGVLLLNTSMAQTSFTIQERQVQLARLSERQQDLAQRLEVAESPQSVAERALAAGMVPAPPPAFLDLAQGTIVGEPVPARAE